MTAGELHFVEDCLQIRRKAPVVHNITNYVAMNFSANVLLSVGASPVMSSEPAEIEELAAISSALVINIGCIEQLQAQAMDMAASAAHRMGKPWVLDPVGVGISRLRTDTAKRLAGEFKPAVIRGNASEIMALAGAGTMPRGVDTANESRVAVEYAVRLAEKYSTVVSVSGPVDYITDGLQVIGLANGSPLMPMVTAMGCSASAVTAAFLAVNDNALHAAADAMALMGVAGERAAAFSVGPGSLMTNFLDVLATLSPAEAAGQIRFSDVMPE